MGTGLRGVDGGCKGAGWVVGVGVGVVEVGAGL